MDPLSITASVITVADVAHRIVKYILDLKNASADLSDLMSELQSLRNELEDFANLSKRAEINRDPESTSQLPSLQRLTDLSDNSSPLACCHQQLNTLIEELERADWGPLGSKRDTLFKVANWPLRQKEITRTRERMNNLIGSLSKGLRYDEVCVSSSVNITGTEPRYADSLINSRNMAMDTNTRVRSIDRQTQSIQEDMNYDTIIKWLNAPDAAINQHQASEKRGAATTGKWLIDSDDYAKWKVQPHSVYWLHGILGCGKTILASTIIDDLSKNCRTSPSSLAYFYFSDRQDCAQMLRSMLRQIANQNKECFEMLGAFYSTHDKGLQQPRLAALSTLLRSMFGICGTTFIVLDALDECKSRGELMEFIEDIDSWHEADYHVLFTSRSELDIRATLESLNHQKYTVNVQESLNTEDIRTHIRYRLLHDKSLQRWQKQPKALEEIEVQLMKKSDGMFLLADHQLDSLQSGYTRDVLLETLGSLPVTLNDQYARILGSTGKNQRKLAMKAFLWLVHSKNPICLDELVDALATDVAARPRFSPTRRLIDKEDIAQICSNLIVVSADHEERVRSSIRFAHSSVKEYFLSGQTLAAPVADFAPNHSHAHAIIARDCLSYLLHVNDCHRMEARKYVAVSQKKCELWEVFAKLSGCDSRKWREEDTESEKELRAALPLVFYAAEYWTHHAKLAGEQDRELFQLMIEAFEPSTFENWHNYVDLGCNLYLDGRFGYMCAPDRLTYAVDKQLPRLVQHLLEQVVEVNTAGSETLTPLQLAANIGNLELVKLLIQFGADIEEYYANKNETSPLCLAAEHGFVHILEYLLDMGADVENRHEKALGTPLMAAASNNHLDVVRILIGKGGDVNATREHDRTALECASDRGHTAMVKLLLSNGISTTLHANAEALRVAAIQGHTEIVKLLLVAGFDVNAIVPATRFEIAVADAENLQWEEERVWFQTAVQFAAERGHIATVRLLINWGADINIQDDGDWRTALQLVCWRGRLELIQLLLESGADVNIRGGLYESALQAASVGFHVRYWGKVIHDTSSENDARKSIISLLIKHGADVNEPGGKFGSPLQAAAHMNRIAAIQTLLEHGANVNQKGGQWGDALHAALENGYGYAAHLLLTAGADSNVKKELQTRLEDTQREISDLFWRDKTGWVRNDKGEEEPVLNNDIPDGVFKLHDSLYFDKSLLKSPSINTSKK
ncbi:MAG: hypothetical protein Q9226_003009 [Calogaya cf. arnoldii]